MLTLDRFAAGGITDGYFGFVAEARFCFIIHVLVNLTSDHSIEKLLNCRRGQIFGSCVWNRVQRAWCSRTLLPLLHEMTDEILSK